MHSDPHLLAHLYKELNREAVDLQHRRVILDGLPKGLSRPPSSVHAKGHRAQGQLRFKVPSRQSALDLAKELPPLPVYLFIEAHGSPTIGPLCSFRTPPETSTQIADFVFRIRHSQEAGAASCVQWWSLLGGVSVQIMAELPDGDVLIERTEQMPREWAVHGVPRGKLVQWGKQTKAYASPLTVHWSDTATALANLTSRHTVDIGDVAENVSFRSE